MHFSFRATLFSLMLAVLLTGAASLGVAAYFYARYAAGDLGGQVLDQAVGRVKQHVEHSLHIAESEAATIEDLLSTGRFDPEDHKAITEFFVSSLRARPGLSYLSFGMPSGKYFHVFRDRNGELSALWLLPDAAGDGRRLVEFSVPADGEWVTVRDIERSVRTPPYERPYYIAAENAGRPIWTESYVFLGSGESLDIPGVSRAVPVFAEGGSQFLGVLTADFDLFAMSRFLRGVNLGNGGLSFIVEVTSGGEPRVIAHPAAADPDESGRLDLTEASPDGDGRTTVRADRVADERVTGFLQTAGADFFKSSDEDHSVKIKAGREPFVGSFLQLDGQGAPHWVICMLLPQSEVFGGVRKMAKFMAVLGVCGVAIAAMLSMLLSRRVAASLGKIAKETEEIGRFRLKKKPPVRSRISEISSLATSVEEMKTGLRSFQKYVPADLVRLLLESGQEAELGGTRCDLTIYFSDIVGFTSVSEQLPPESLVKILSRYLEEMSDEILQAGGTVDKFIGDAIMAFWGAPKRHKAHARAACLSALANQLRLSQLRKEWAGEGMPEFRARIGLHTGSAIVGNFGSPNRLDYTAIGDAVNLASRLEGLNRLYGTDILISDSTREAAGDGFVTRRVDRVSVKGREGSTLIYELVGEEDSTSGEKMEGIRSYEAALDLYLARDWARAKSGFAALLEDLPHDPGIKMMVERCQALQARPPGDDWDGAFQAPKA